MFKVCFICILAPVDQLIDLMIVVVIMSHPPQTLDVVPAGPPEQRRVNTGVTAHGPVRQVVDGPELVVQTLRRVLVEPGDGRVALLVPGEVLDPEGGELVLSLGKVHILEVCVTDIEADVRDDTRVITGVAITGLAPDVVEPGLELLLGRGTVLAIMKP